MCNLNFYVSVSTFFIVLLHFFIHIICSFCRYYSPPLLPPRLNIIENVSRYADCFDTLYRLIWAETQETCNIETFAFAFNKTVCVRACVKKRERTREEEKHSDNIALLTVIMW